MIVDLSSATTQKNQIMVQPILDLSAVETRQKQYSGSIVADN